MNKGLIIAIYEVFIQEESKTPGKLLLNHTNELVILIYIQIISVPGKLHRNGT